jgi:hypothetical protein
MGRSLARDVAFPDFRKRFDGRGYTVFGIKVKKIFMQPVPTYQASPMPKQTFLKELMAHLMHNYSP